MNFEQAIDLHDHDKHQFRADIAESKDRIRRVAQAIATADGMPDLRLVSKQGQKGYERMAVAALSEADR